MEELKRIIDDSEITKEDDALWPPPDRVGRQVCDTQNVPVNQFFYLYFYTFILLYLNRTNCNLKPIGLSLNSDFVTSLEKVL